MRRREILVLCVFFLFPSFLPGEDQDLFPFPAAPLLEIIAAGKPAWRPDWPEDFPPDAFSLTSGQALSLTLDNGSGPITLGSDPEGRLREFPFFLNGAFIQVRAGYDPSGGLQSLSAGSPENSWRFDFPQAVSPESFVPGDAPVLVNRGGVRYFVLFLETGSALSETWYDGEGNFLAYYKALIRRDGPRWRIRSLEFHREEEPYREDYDVDNADNITGVSSPRGDFTALYRDGLPRYWERRPVPVNAGSGPDAEALPDTGSPAPPAPEPAGSPEAMEEGPGNFVLQWDENSLLVEKRTLRGETGGEFRYEYERDHRGNWVKRRELEMVDRSGVRVPLFRRELVRRMVYSEE
jgi:hypothetical protein